MRFLRWLFPPSDYRLGRVLFLRALGLIYLIALVSWWVQAGALTGKDGLVPVSTFLEQAGEILDGDGRSRIWNLPTLFWINSSDGFIHAICAAGTVLALLVIAGVASGPCLLGLWAVYLSLVSTGNVFMNFQWDILLLEAGVLGILVAPWSVKFLPWRNPPPLGLGERIALWLCWFAIAKIMFQSGWVKLAWATPQQPEWWPEHTAMTFHYMTQPIPTWTAWWMDQLPAWIHKASIWPMYFVELILPALVFLGARLRLVAAIGFAGLMLLILLTGNYTYFNWLTIVMCLPLVADRYWWWPRRIRIRSSDRENETGARPPPVESPMTGRSFEDPGEIVSISLRGLPLLVVAGLNVIVCFSDWHGVSRRITDPILRGPI